LGSAKRFTTAVASISGAAFIIIGYAIPAFLFAVLLIVFFAGGSYFDIFPLRGLVSADFSTLPWYKKITDYFWHITLPVLATVIGGFAALTMLTKNAFMDEIRKQYVVTARKGVGEKQIMWKHVFRNAMLLVIAGFPATFISMFFTGSLLIESDVLVKRLGLLWGYEATVSRDYPVMFGTLYIFTLIGLLLNIISDISYTLVDPESILRVADAAFKPRQPGPLGPFSPTAAATGRCGFLP
jgi:microcin C transport system permease protein